MNTRRKANILFCLLAICFTSALADSPLTSIDLHKAYSNLPYFASLKTKDAYDYLSNEENPIEYRLAVICKDGWDIDGKNRADGFKSYLKSKYNADETDYMDKVPGKTLVCLAYMKALDDYFNVNEALKIAEYAVSKEPESYSVLIIDAMIKAQIALHEGRQNWSNVYKATNDIRQIERFLNMDMSRAAINIIFKYMDIYAHYYYK